VSAVAEVLNIMLSHALTTLARLQGTTFRPQAILVQSGPTEQLVASLPRGPAATVRVAHARLHLEGAFHGAEMALLGAGIP
jgi:chemotaxis protein CheY-P-specific phosphatase CheC